MNSSEALAIEQVRVLWPYLSITQRWDFIEKLRHLFDDSYFDTFQALNGMIID